MSRETRRRSFETCEVTVPPGAAAEAMARLEEAIEAEKEAQFQEFQERIENWSWWSSETFGVVGWELLGRVSTGLGFVQVGLQKFQLTMSRSQTMIFDCITTT